MSVPPSQCRAALPGKWPGRCSRRTDGDSSRSSRWANVAASSCAASAPASTPLPSDPSSSLQAASAKYGPYELNISPLVMERDRLMLEMVRGELVNLSAQISSLEWERAKHASRDAWHRLSDSVERVIPGDSDRDGR